MSDLSTYFPFPPKILFKNEMVDYVQFHMPCTECRYSYIIMKSFHEDLKVVKKDTLKKNKIVTKDETIETDNFTRLDWHSMDYLFSNFLLFLMRISVNNYR